MTIGDDVDFFNNTQKMSQVKSRFSEGGNESSGNTGQ
jgi:hypothetical protein